MVFLWKDGDNLCERKMKGKADRDRKLFVSFFFIAFFVITLGLFYLLPGKWRVSFLCLMSCFWCAYLDIRSLFILVAGMLYCYLGGILLEWHRALRKESSVKNQPVESRKWLLLLLVGFCVLWITVISLGLIFVPFLHPGAGIHSDAARDADGIFFLSVSDHFLFCGYLSWKCKGRTELLESGFVAFLFSEAGQWTDWAGALIFCHQLQNVRKVTFWNTGRISVSLSYVLYGYFLKIVIADRLMPMVDRIFNNPGGFDSFFLILGAVLYTFQIYCDFAGYSYIAVGLSELVWNSSDNEFQRALYGTVHDRFLAQMAYQLKLLAAGLFIYSAWRKPKGNCP